MTSQNHLLNRAAVALLAASGVWAALTLRLAHAADWPLGVLFALVLASTVVSLVRTLPAQNIFAAAALILGIAGVIQTLGVNTGIPFGPILFTDTLGEKMPGGLPWAAPLLWVIVILNCRGVARLILRPWRKLRTYGFRVIGLTVLLAVLFDAALEPFATHVNRWWLWQKSSSGTIFGAPWVNFLGWGVTALFILAFLTPWLINKRPVPRPPDFHPLVLWLALNLFLAASLALHALWPPAILTLAVSVVAATSAWRNAA